ncbi:MAG: T9SS type A sorting domain-containing protein [Lewinellaceae bacterium]|nr:T9SS type A sorting domain-containing protein [Lewinellaceae bacterium]
MISRIITNSSSHIELPLPTLQLNPDDNRCTGPFVPSISTNHMLKSYSTSIDLRKNKIHIVGLAFLFLGWLNLPAQVQVGQVIYGDTLGDAAGSALSMPDEKTIAIAAHGNSGKGLSGHVRVLSLNGGQWIQKGPDIYDLSEHDWTGWSIDMPDANTLAVGTINSNIPGKRAGHVRIFEWDGQSWEQKGQTIVGESAGDRCGSSVSMPDANTIAIGAYQNGGNGPQSGHVRIFTWDGEFWIQKGQDIDGEGSFDRSGCSVCMPDPNTIAIGAYLNNGNGINAGHVRIYKWNDSAWIQKGQDIDGQFAGFRLGFSVSMPDENTIAIGADLIEAPGKDTGRIQVFTWYNHRWVQKGQDIMGSEVKDLTGFSVSMPDANTVAYGAFGSSLTKKQAGVVRMFSWSGSQWMQIGQDIYGELPFDWFGHSLSMPDHKTIGIGAPGDFRDTGFVKVYRLPESRFIYKPVLENIVVYPNPTKDEITIQFDEVQHRIELSLQTPNGKILDVQTHQNISVLPYKIPAPPGVFLLHISNGLQEATIRVVKE